MGIGRAIISDTKYMTPLIIVLSFIIAYFAPDFAGFEIGNTLLAFIGILFGIIVGFFITDLYSRFSAVRENVGVEASGWSTYYSFCKILGRFKRHSAWVEKQRKLIGKYIYSFLRVEWHEYAELEKDFSDIMDSLQELDEVKTNKEVETYTNMLVVLSSISDAREKLVMYGKDKLTRSEWAIIYSLAFSLIGILFYVKTSEIVSIIFTGVLTSTVIILLFVVKDLSSLRFGEQTVSFEPYERVLDTLGFKRFYEREDLDHGRVTVEEHEEFVTD